MNDKEKHGIQEEKNGGVGEDTTKYGEFVSSYFAWVSPNEQKDRVEEMENITKSENERKSEKRYKRKRK